ncbi:MAG: helix-turn-helix domain-containing protein [Lachnospiraceae bacterium]|nr:helix-turn-helix domain-containing protein [Lachnospiraceae bacterium]
MAFEKLYTAEDVAQITGLTLRTIRNYIKSGRLKGHRVGVQWRFTEADIQALFAGSSPTSDTALTTSAPAASAPVMDAAAIAAISAAASAMVTAGSGAAVMPGIVSVPGGAGSSGVGSMVMGSGAAAQAEMTVTAEEPLSENDDQILRFVQRKNAPRTCACAIVDKPGMTEQEARFLFNRLQTLANVYADTPKRLEVTYEYDENREQARFVFSGAMEAACAMMNLCDVQ